MLVTVFVFIGIEGASVYTLRQGARRRRQGDDHRFRHRHLARWSWSPCCPTPCCSAPTSPACASRRWRRAGAVVGPVGRDLRQRRPARLGAWRLPRLGADLRRGDVRRRQVQGHAQGLREPTPTAVPAVALWVDEHGIIQLIVISTYWSRDAFALMLNLTSATTLIPWFSSPPTGWMIAKRRPDLRSAPRERAARPDPAAIVAVSPFSTLFMIWAGGLAIHPAVAVLFAPGTILYFIARREQANRCSTRPSDWITFGVIVGRRHLRRSTAWPRRDRDRFRNTAARSSRQIDAWQPEAKATRKTANEGQGRAKFGVHSEVGQLRR